MNSKQIVVLLGSAIVTIGVIGSLGTDKVQTVTVPLTGGNQSSLEVKRGNNLPTSTIDYLQGSGSLQGQGKQPQSSNVGEQLQPNAGADSLPKNY